MNSQKLNIILKIKLQDIVNDLQQATIKNIINDEISFDINAKNICSTPNENTRDRPNSFILEETLAKFLSISEKKIKDSRCTLEMYLTLWTMLKTILQTLQTTQTVIVFPIHRSK